MASKQNGDGTRRSIYFPPNSYQGMEQARLREGLSRSAFVCRAIDHYARDKKHL